jgi:hypothetical protein|tara:strand:- start:248 stop:430 length:183 start_codon:yes stop_codon:yes gene_type:complete
MELAKEYITNTDGTIKSVVVDYAVFQKIEEVLLDDGLAKAMEEIGDDEVLSLNEARNLAK